MQHPASLKTHHRFAALMALIAACGPFALDSYLPGIPYMARDLGVSPDKIATTVSIFVLGLALGQLIGGPLSDRFGRKTMILMGLSIYSCSCLVMSQTHQLTVIQIGRFIQALGGGFAFVCVPALIRDRASGAEAAKLFALVGLIMVAAPALAPAFGTLLITLGNWQSVFYFMVGYPLIVIIMVTKFITAPATPSSADSISALARYRHVMQIKPAYRYLIAQALIFSQMMVFIANASFIYQQYYQLADHWFALLFAANIILMALTNRLNACRLNHYSPNKLLRQGTRIQLLAVLGLTLATGLGHPLWAIATGIIITIGMQGAIMPNISAVYMSHFKQHTGAASALMGATNFICGALFSAISTWLFNGGLWPVTLTILTLSVSANLLLHWKMPHTMAHPLD
ncbi:multidrug effflux MFS transporter [Celerinatantimonas sp. YJH-8]|uniref:multidrug effflux MFS transporter n=1 Tax=Celerinatantimonas sp. YJH-8 TaxID=3228714 RepID=UPI0038C34DD6